jgi:CTP:molybdopterin cytidylyltransferase MocA
VSVVGAVLAAGSSRRLGAPKQLLPLYGERSLVHHAAAEVLASGAERVAVIVGAHAAAVSRAVAELDVELVHNLDHAEGLASSIRAAVAWARYSRAEALLLSLCDQPRLSRIHLRRLLDEAQARADRPAASYYAGKPAVPAVFPARYFEDLFTLEGDRGAASLLQSSPGLSLVSWPEGELDIDTQADVERCSS